ncbi:Bromodomain-containing protein [Mytilinidion resinicola]|uniref:Bromodomain-containing protein n=1 Tax=Mytilinidion resinicola TaxID=574789 RepID=A0A6A6YBE7_9PEZI|nr:Bromodomain-containing protein [Mytilinidion resinicola]KAF2806156.1 Bromodomain-containing protein [Mytilinidion resinicola]
MAVMTSSAFDTAPFEGKAPPVLSETMILDSEVNGIAHKYDALFDEPEIPSLDPSAQPAEPVLEEPVAINGNGNHVPVEDQTLVEDAPAPITDVSSGIAPIAQFIPETTTDTSITTAVEAPTSDIREDTRSVPTAREPETDIVGASAGETDLAPQSVAEPVSKPQTTDVMDISQEVLREVSQEVSEDVSQEFSKSDSYAPAALVTQDTEMDTEMDSFLAPATEVLEPSGDITTLKAGTHTPIEDQLTVETQPEAALAEMSFTQSPITVDQEMTDVPSAGKVRSREDDDEEEPSAKRTKTDEEMVNSTEFKMPEVPGPKENHPADGTLTIADQASIQRAVDAQPWPPGPINKAQNKFLLERVRNTKKIKVSTAFRDPVDPVALGIPNYPDFVKNPMSLQDMETKLKTDKYASVTEFMMDLDLVVDNSIAFNGIAHPVSQAGLNMRAYFLKGMIKLPRDEIPQQPAHKRLKKPVVSTTSKPRRESRAAAIPVASPVVATPTVTSPQNLFPLNHDGTPIIRRDSSNATDRPKREIHRPPPKDLPYNSVKPKKKKYQLEMKFCESVLSALTKPKYKALAMPFMQPVDPVALNIPNYLRIIKKPMDLSTVERNLKEGLYQTSKEFYSDVKLIFDNCYKFNPPEDVVHKMGKDFQAVFEELWAEKSDWLANNREASQPPSPTDSEEEEEDDDEVDAQTAELMALQQQMAQLNEKAQRLIQQKAGKRMSPKAPTKKGSKSSAKQAPKRKSSTLVPPLKHSKQRRQEKEPAPLSFAQKQEISDGISTLGDVDMRKAVQIIRNGVPHLAAVNDDEMEIDMDEINDATLRKLLSFIKSVKGPKVRDDDDFAPRGRAPKAPAPSKPKKNKPMGKEEQENKIKQIRQQLQNFDANASNSDQSPPAAQNDDSSEDDDESGSESEEE